MADEVIKKDVPLEAAGELPGISHIGIDRKNQIFARSA